MTICFRRLFLCIAGLALILSCAIAGEDERGRPGRRGPRGPGQGRQGEGQGRQGEGQRPPRQRQGPPETFKTDVTGHAMDVILGCPTDSSVTVRILSFSDNSCSIAFGTSPQNLTGKTSVKPLSKDTPVDFLLSPLQADTKYFYQIIPGNTATPTTGSFHTQRQPGSPFSFTITADSHLDDRTEPEIYRRTLLNLLADAPDFHIDLGDTFMNDKKDDNRADLLKQYLAQRYYFGLVGHSAPLYLVVGNHDGESIRENDGSTGCLAAWSNATRKNYFPNPISDGFYSGNTCSEPNAGQLEDYYAWTWGDALFIVLDPYWYSERQRGGDDNWKRSLGETQYRWLKSTLETSKARFTFVFIHQLVGGIEKPGRGGAEAAGLYEWGGKDPDGTQLFTIKRPGWGVPIHQLLAKRPGTIVFHGHDHLYVKEDLDGIVYQEVPQPGFGGRFDEWKVQEAGYLKGVARGGAGYLRVTVQPEQATVEYFQTDLQGGTGGTLAHSYSVLGSTIGARTENGR